MAEPDRNSMTVNMVGFSSEEIQSARETYERNFGRLVRRSTSGGENRDGFGQTFINKDQLEDILTCQICFEIKEQPKLLSCHHSFCQKCLRRFWKDPEPGRQITCAACRQITVVPQKGIAGLQTDFYASKLMDGVGENEPLLPSKRHRDTSQKIPLAVGLVTVLVFLLIAIGVSVAFFGWREPTDQDDSVVKAVPANRGMALTNNGTVVCIGDSKDGKINMTLLSVTDTAINVQKSVTVSLEPTNLKSVQENEMILVDKESGIITKWSLPDFKLTASYPSVFAIQNSTIVGNVVSGDSLYVLFFKGTIARFLIEGMTYVEQYNLDPKYFHMGDYFMYLGPKHAYKGGLEDNPNINVFDITDGSLLSSISTDCYRRPYTRDGYLGSKGKTNWELRDTTTLKAVLRADLSRYLPPGRTLAEQKVRFGVYKSKYVAVFTSFFGLVFDLESRSVIKEIESPELRKGNIPPHPVIWVSDKVFIVGFKDNTVHKFVL